MIHGVMVALRFLVSSVKVRVLVDQQKKLQFIEAFFVLIPFVIVNYETF